jgi:hypothetical protein
MNPIAVIKTNIGLGEYTAIELRALRLPTNRFSGFLGFGCPSSYNVTADSQPQHDGWGPDCYWDCVDWVNWHKQLVLKYGKEKADDLWATEFDKSSYGSHEISCSTGNQSFKDYAQLMGLDKKSTILTKVYRAESDYNTVVAQPFKNISNALDSSTAAAANAAKGAEKGTESAANVLSWLPYVLVAGAVLVIGFIVYSNSNISELKKSIA